MPGLIVPPELTFGMQPMQPFGFGVGCLSVRHGDGTCNCVVGPAGAVLSQGLEELDFLRGACSAAQVCAGVDTSMGLRCALLAALCCHKG